MDFGKQQITDDGDHGTEEAQRRRHRPIQSRLLAVIFYLVIFTVLISCLNKIPQLTRRSALVASSNVLGSNGKPRLTLSHANTFDLVIFADLHYGEEENGWGIDQDRKSANVMRAVLDKETPDLIVLNGDLITGENTFRENSSEYIHTVIAPLVERNIPWASTYGNHDSKFNLSREASFAIESSYALSLTQQMDKSLPGITNYYLLLYAAGDSMKPVAVLWFFDSRGGASYQHLPPNVDDIPNWVGPETTSWFTSTSRALRKQHGDLPSLAFVHIPPHPFLTAQRKGISKSRFPGVNEDIPVSIQGAGEEDAQFVAALRAEKGLNSIYVGHDHGNAWCSLWPQEGRFPSEQSEVTRSHNDGPFLCFSKHTGYGGYGDWNRGARVVRLEFRDGGEIEVQTWVRMEDGGVVTKVSLNETYGIDEYPTATGD